jgi:hypothetical protein
MKKVLLLLSLALIGFASCNKDHENTTPEVEAPQNPLLGVWNFLNVASADSTLQADLTLLYADATLEFQDEIIISAKILNKEYTNDSISYKLAEKDGEVVLSFWDAQADPIIESNAFVALTEANDTLTLTEAQAVTTLTRKVD